MRIFPTDEDDDRFIEIVETVIGAIMDQDSPRTLRLIRVDNWFGVKWRGFAGKVLGAFGVGGGRLVIPPFVPSRVDSEHSWTKGESGYVVDSDFEVLHERIRSEGNLSRYFDKHCPETIAVWFSSKSSSNGRGSIMVYSDVGMDRTYSWYVELAAPKGWRPSVAHGITPSGFLNLLSGRGIEGDRGSPPYA